MTDFGAQRPRYQPYQDVEPTPFRWRLGVRPLDLDDWLQVDDQYAADIATKAAIMAAHPDTAFGALADIDSESAEVADLVADALDAMDDPRLRAVDPTLHPLDAAGRAIQEDLVLMVERGGRLVCGGGSVCFPNRWDLRSKLGRSMSEIHAPVAQLNDQLAEPIDAFLGRLTPDRSFWRLGWGVLDTDELYQPTDGTAAPRPHAAPPSEHVLRVERETLRRLPRTGAVLFTIRTYLTPLAGWSDPTGTTALADALDALPAEVASYKQLDGVGTEIADWLRHRATTTTQ